MGCCQLLQCPLVQPTANLAVRDGADDLHRPAIGREAVRVKLFGCTMASERFSQELQGCLLASSLCDVAFEDFALGTDGPPEVVLDAVDPDKNLVRMSVPMSKMPQLERDLV